ncbi:MAG: hypothetical protein R3F62_15790 [Planctomycetota bacterium]
MKIAPLAVCLVWLASGWALGGTAAGEVVVDGATVYVVGTSRVEVVGDARDASSFAGRLAQLAGEQVTIRGPLRKQGREIVPKLWVDPQPVELRVTWVGKDAVRVQDQVVPATGLLLPVAPENTRFEAYLFRSEERITRVHLGRALVTYAGRPGFVRTFETTWRAGSIPLPSGGTPLVCRWKVHTFTVEDREGRVLEAAPRFEALTFVQGQDPESAANPATGGIAPSLGSSD